jgi:hypothetical protein
MVTADGYLYLFGTSVSKIELSSRTVLNEIEVYTSDSSTKISFNRGVINSDESVIIGYSTGTGGPN